MRTLIVGMGEVGQALHQVLWPYYEVHTKDLAEATIPDGIEIMHVCIRYSEKFHEIVRGYADRYRPRLIDVCTTCPPGTTELLGEHAVHSTTRGLHPNLAKGLRAIVKHVGGPKAREVIAYFEKAGVRCFGHRHAITTEVAHLLNNAAYGVNLMLADEMARVCRHYGVDYVEAVIEYTMTHNEGFRALDHASKQRPVLTPPGGKIGGHCVAQSGQMLLDSLGGAAGAFVRRLAGYNRESE